MKKQMMTFAVAVMMLFATSLQAKQFGTFGVIVGGGKANPNITGGTIVSECAGTKEEFNMGETMYFDGSCEGTELTIYIGGQPYTVTLKEGTTNLETQFGTFGVIVGA